MRCAGILLLAALAAACGERQPDEVRVFAASSLTEVMQTIAADFERETGTRVKLNVASSSTLAKQIVEGAPCDVFLSADQEWADFVEKAGLVEPGTRRDLLTNYLILYIDLENRRGPRGVTIDERLNIVCYSGQSDTSEDVPGDWVLQELRKPHIRRIAIGDPEHVPAGKYGRAALQKLGIWEEMSPRVVRCESVRGAVSLFLRGEADAAVMYGTDALSIIDRMFPRRSWPHRLESPAIRYPVLVTRGSPSHALAFLEALESPAASTIFEKAGFGLAQRGE